MPMITVIAAPGVDPPGSLQGLYGTYSLLGDLSMSVDARDLFNANLAGMVVPSMTFYSAGAPSNGASGTHAGVAPAAALLIDSTNKVLYQNSNTLLSPTWVALTTATGAGTYTGTFNGTGVFDGSVGGVTPAAGAFTTLAASSTSSLAAVTATTVAATNLTASGFVRDSVATALTAIGTNRGTSLALTKAINFIATAAASTGVTLEASAMIGVGGHQDIYHDGANAIQVYGAGSDTIDTVAGSTGVVLTNARRCRYTVKSAGVIVSAQLGVVSA